MDFKKVLFVSPHPDDETLGAGGTILNFKEKKIQTHWCIFTEIDGHDNWSKSFIKKRKNDIKKVSNYYNFESSINLGFPTTKLDQIGIGNLIEKFTKYIDHIKPDTIFLNNFNDVHSDHSYVHRAVISSIKYFRKPFVKSIYIYETISETEFVPTHLSGFYPNTFIDISKNFRKKINIMKKFYSSEVMPNYLPRSISSIESLARFRGSRISTKYAESFMLVFRKID